MISAEELGFQCSVVSFSSRDINLFSCFSYLFSVYLLRQHVQCGQMFILSRERPFTSGPVCVNSVEVKLK